MFQLIMTLILSVSAHAFEGQPKEIVAMPNFASKVAITFADLGVSDLKQEKFSCRQSPCSVLATVASEIGAQAGSVQWRARYVRVLVGADGQYQMPMQPSAMFFEELETGNRLTMIFNESDDNKTICFGMAGNNSGRSCTTYKVIDTH